MQVYTNELELEDFVLKLKYLICPGKQCSPGIIPKNLDAQCFLEFTRFHEARLTLR